MQFQVLLPGKRGVRIKSLPPSTRDKVLGDAAKIVGAEGSFIELRTTEQLLGVKAMLVAVTERAGLKDEDLLDPATKWKMLTAVEIDDKYDSTFSSKDHQALAALYRELHEVSAAEVESIVGKLLPVSEAV